MKYVLIQSNLEPLMLVFDFVVQRGQAWRQELEEEVYQEPGEHSSELKHVVAVVVVDQAAVAAVVVASSSAFELDNIAASKTGLDCYWC